MAAKPLASARPYSGGNAVFRYPTRALLHFHLFTPSRKAVRIDAHRPDLVHAKGVRSHFQDPLRNTAVAPHDQGWPCKIA